MTERDPLLLCLPQGSLRVEGAGSLECARWSATGQRVCLRKVPVSPAALAAIEAALQLPVHPALAAALDGGVWKGDAWLVTDFPDGTLLGDSDRRLPSDFGPVAEALGALHARGATHGLLSSQALLLTPSGTLMLHEVAMLELNRVTDRRPEQTLLAQLQRTAAYFSPQRLKGGAPAAADDVYALGVLVGLAAGGARPADGSVLEQLHAVMSGAWKPSPPATLPHSLVQLLQRMTARDPAGRPLASEVAGQLQPPPILPRSVIPAPAPTAPGAPAFELIPPPAPTITSNPPVHLPPIEPIPAPAPTVPNQALRASGPKVRVGGAAAVIAPPPPRGLSRLTALTVSIAASDARLITAGLLAIAMLSSTIALGAHVMTSREEAREVVAAQQIKPVAPQQPRYTAEQLKQILRQKEEARREY